MSDFDEIVEFESGSSPTASEVFVVSTYDSDSANPVSEMLDGLRQATRKFRRTEKARRRRFAASVPITPELLPKLYAEIDVAAVDHIDLLFELPGDYVLDSVPQVVLTEWRNTAKRAEAAWFYAVRPLVRFARAHAGAVDWALMFRSEWAFLNHDQMAAERALAEDRVDAALDRGYRPPEFVAAEAGLRERGREAGSRALEVLATADAPARTAFFEAAKSKGSLQAYLLRSTPGVPDAQALASAAPWVEGFLEVVGGRRSST